MQLNQHAVIRRGAGIDRGTYRIPGTAEETIAINVIISMKKKLHVALQRKHLRTAHTGITDTEDKDEEGDNDEEEPKLAV